MASDLDSSSAPLSSQEPGAAQSASEKKRGRKRNKKKAVKGQDEVGLLDQAGVTSAFE